MGSESVWKLAVICLFPQGTTHQLLIDSYDVKRSMDHGFLHVMTSHKADTCFSFTYISWSLQQRQTFISFLDIAYNFDKQQK
jgi:hypothetical protein